MGPKRCIILVLALLATGCGGKAATTSQSQSPTPTPSESVRPANAVDVDDSVFRPQTLTVAAGTTVTWTQFGSFSHTVTSTKKLFNSHPNCKQAGTGPAFSGSTGCMKKGDVFKYTFANPGVYNYYCYLHSFPDLAHPDLAPPRMGGTITVT